MLWKCPECDYESDYSTIKCPCGYVATGKEEIIEQGDKSASAKKQEMITLLLFIAAIIGVFVVNTFNGSIHPTIRWIITIGALGGGAAIGWIIVRVSSYKNNK